jgi:hypothetical protein
MLSSSSSVKTFLLQIKTLRSQLDSFLNPTSADTITAQDKTQDSCTFYRYIRPINDLTGESNSNQGVTFKITLDYIKRVINFSYAICNHKKGEPNFSKVVGRQIVETRPTYTIPMWSNPGRLSNADITTFLISAIHNKKVMIPKQDSHNILDQFDRSLFNFYIQ